jgi:hypothetical protein
VQENNLFTANLQEIHLSLGPTTLSKDSRGDFDKRCAPLFDVSAAIDEGKVSAIVLLNNPDSENGFHPTQKPWARHKHS